MSDRNARAPAWNFQVVVSSSSVETKKKYFFSELGLSPILSQHTRLSQKKSTKLGFDLGVQIISTICVSVLDVSDPPIWGWPWPNLQGEHPADRSIVGQDSGPWMFFFRSFFVGCSGAFRSAILLRVAWGWLVKDWHHPDLIWT